MCLRVNFSGHFVTITQAETKDTLEASIVNYK